MSFEILKPEQAMPVLTGMKTMGEVLKTAEDTQLAKQQAESYRIANELNTPKIKYAPQMAESELNQALANIGLTKANTGLANANVADIYQGRIPLQKAQAGQADSEAALNKLKLQNPLLINTTGMAGQVGAMVYLAQHPELLQALQNSDNNGTIPTAGQTPPAQSQPNWQQSIAQTPTAQTQPQTFSFLPKTGNPWIDSISNAMTIDQSLKMARTQYFNKSSEARNWALTPIDERSAMLAQAAGLGIDPTEATQRFMNGESIADMARSQGFDPKQMPEPLFAPTKATLNQVQMRKSALAEMNTLDPILSNALAPYSRQIFNMSPKLMAQAISGSDKDAQAKALAARAIMPELSGIRFRAMSGKQLGVEVMKEITDKSMNTLDQYHSLIAPDVYKQATKYIEDWITLGVNNANNAITSNFSQMENAIPNNVSLPASTSSAIPQTQTPKGVAIGTIKQLNGKRWKKIAEGKWQQL